MNKTLVDLDNNLMLRSENIEYDGDSLKNELDTIIESGSNSNGSWVKFSNGTMICYGTWELGDVIPSGAVGSVYNIAITAIHSWPVPFIKKPQTHFTAYEYVEDWGMLLIPCPKKNTVTASGFGNINVVSISNAKSNLAIDYIAIGKWK